jgi:ribonuclease-3
MPRRAWARAWTAATGRGVPEYRITDEGPDHAKEFTATAVVAGRDLGVGVGRTKKDAEQKAAQAAYEALQVGDGPDDPGDSTGTGDAAGTDPAGD